MSDYMMKFNVNTGALESNIPHTVADFIYKFDERMKKEDCTIELKRIEIINSTILKYTVKYNAENIVDYISVHFILKDDSCQKQCWKIELDRVVSDDTDKSMHILFVRNNNPAIMDSYIKFNYINDDNTTAVCVKSKTDRDGTRTVKVYNQNDLFVAKLVFDKWARPILSRCKYAKNSDRLDDKCKHDYESFIDLIKTEINNSYISDPEIEEEVYLLKEKMIDSNIMEWDVVTDREAILLPRSMIMSNTTYDKYDSALDVLNEWSNTATKIGNTKITDDISAISESLRSYMVTTENYGKDSMIYLRMRITDSGPIVKTYDLVTRRQVNII
jgi:hypothetical protein